MNPLARYILNNLIALDIGTNTLFAGSPFETISSRMWRKRETRFGAFAVRCINWLFRLFGEEDHCKKAEQKLTPFELWR